MSKSLTFDEKRYPESMRIANELADAESKHFGMKVTPHNTIDRLIRDAGARKLRKLQGTKK